MLEGELVGSFDMGWGGKEGVGHGCGWGEVGDCTDLWEPL